MNVHIQYGGARAPISANNTKGTEPPYDTTRFKLLFNKGQQIYLDGTHSSVRLATAAGNRLETPQNSSQRDEEGKSCEQASEYDVTAAWDMT